MSPHEYAKSCKCRGCVAVRKAKWRAALIALPLMLLAPLAIGFLVGGHPFGSFAGIISAGIGWGIFSAVNPSNEVLKPDDKNPIKLSR